MTHGVLCQQENALRRDFILFASHSIRNQLLYIDNYSDRFCQDCFYSQLKATVSPAFSSGCPTALLWEYNESNTPQFHYQITVENKLGLYIKAKTWRNNMTSQKQIDANRLNARKSTGPKTPESALC